jgi:hypothetical protein
MKRFYLAAAVVGAVVPLTFFGLHFVRSGFDLGQLAADAIASPASTAFLADLLISVVVALAFVAHDGRRLGIGRFGAVLAGTLCIGLSFSLPLYLYWREARLERGGSRSPVVAGAPSRLSLEKP